MHALCVLQVSEQRYAVKSIRKSRIRRLGEQRTFELLERERRTLKLLGTVHDRASAFLMTLLCTAHDSEHLHLVMPL